MPTGVRKPRTLTVAELMDQLQHFPLDALVVAPDPTAAGFFVPVTARLKNGPDVVYNGDNGFDPSRSPRAEHTAVLEL